jgi:hypothetical protein
VGNEVGRALGMIQSLRTDVANEFAIYKHKTNLYDGELNAIHEKLSTLIVAHEEKKSTKRRRVPYQSPGSGPNLNTILEASSI